MLKTSLNIFLLTFLSVSFFHSANASLPFSVAGQELPSLAPMLENTSPAVVNISTVTNVRVRQYNPLFDDPFFRQFFEAPQPSQRERIRKRQGLGSGVIFDAKNGLIVTNTHVIEGVDEINITLKDGREYKAKIVGQDKETDIAIIRVEADNLTEVKLGDSDRLRVGDFVVAIGNPFGLRQTVTSGIVSGLGRSGLGIEGYEDFIQTDASINPGNSGGALVNLRGELIGINTAIIAPSGGSVGINFAIPINMVLQLKPQLVKYGEVKRGHLGIEVQDLTPALAQALNIDIEQGALISTVQEGSVAAKAGLRSGDVVVMANAKPIENASDLRNIYGLTRVGESIEMDVLRGSQFLKIVATLTDELAARTGDDLHPRLQGATFSDMTSGEGVLVSNLEIGSLAHSTGLQQGDIIQAANRKRVNNLEGFRSAVKARNSLMLNIRRGSNNLLILLQ
ncbi:MAG: DegQ family serine endoprotease [Arenicella sp.]